MTQDEYNEAAALVVRLRKDLELHTDALKQSNAHCGTLLVQNEQLTAELDRMKGDPLPIKLVGKLKDAEDSNKTLHSELVEVRAALAATTEQRDSLKRTLDEWERADTKPHERIEPPLRMGLVSAGGPVYIHDDVADHVVPPVLPLCTTCHGCGSVLYPSPAGDYFGCGDVRCTRSNTKHWHPGCTIGPYAGPCKSATPVRHE
jgi:hypothetical protein